jgi:hypothetical protein
MDQEALNYLKTEREISAFRAESLRKLSEKGSASTKRLLAIEDEFISLPFEELADDVAGLLCAINIFRNSRTAFYEMYGVGGNKPKINTTSLPILRAALDAEIISMADKQTDFSAKASRHFGRVMVVLLAILNHLDKAITRIAELAIIVDHNDLIKEIGRKYERDIFSIYNDIISGSYNAGPITRKVREIISDTKPLVNIVNGEAPGFYEITSGKIKSKSLSGFFIPSKHSGREILRPYHFKLIDEDGFDISGCFEPDTKSLLMEISNEYYKFIPIISLAKIKDNLIVLDKYNSLIKKIYHAKLDGLSNIKLDISLSTIMVPMSRTEDEGLKEASIAASAIFNRLVITTINL